jgi:hypothetical protein
MFDLLMERRNLSSNLRPIKFGLDDAQASIAALGCCRSWIWRPVDLDYVTKGVAVTCVAGQFDLDGFANRGCEIKRYIAQRPRSDAGIDNLLL